MKLFFDTETTGKADFKASHEAKHQPHIVQLGALLTEDDGTERASIDVIIKPDGWTVSADVAAIHGISTEMAMRCGIPLFSAMSAFNNMLACADTLVAHNIDFDLKMMKAEFFRLGKTFVENGKTIYCTMKNSTNILKLPGPYGFKWPTLQEAHLHFLKDGFSGAHSAMVDVLACKRVYYAMNQPVQKVEKNELDDLGPMPFGDRKGTPMQDVPASYLFYLHTTGIHDDKRPDRMAVADYIRRNIEALKKDHPDGIW